MAPRPTRLTELFWALEWVRFKLSAAATLLNSYVVGVHFAVCTVYMVLALLTALWAPACRADQVVTYEEMEQARVAELDRQHRMQMYLHQKQMRISDLPNKVQRLLVGKVEQAKGDSVIGIGIPAVKATSPNAMVPSRSPVKSSVSSVEPNAQLGAASVPAAMPARLSAPYDGPGYESDAAAAGARAPANQASHAAAPAANAADAIPEPLPAKKRRYSFGFATIHSIAAVGESRPFNLSQLFGLTPSSSPRKFASPGVSQQNSPRKGASPGASSPPSPRKQRAGPRSWEQQLRDLEDERLKQQQQRYDRNLASFARLSQMVARELGAPGPWSPGSSLTSRAVALAGNKDAVGNVDALGVAGLGKSPSRRPLPLVGPGTVSLWSQLATPRAMRKASTVAGRVRVPPDLTLPASFFSSLGPHGPGHASARVSGGALSEVKHDQFESKYPLGAAVLQQSAAKPEVKLADYKRPVVDTAILTARTTALSQVINPPASSAAADTPITLAAWWQSYFDFDPISFPTTGVVRIRGQASSLAATVENLVLTVNSAPAQLSGAAADKLDQSADQLDEKHGGAPPPLPPYGSTGSPAVGQVCVTAAV